jgi:putative AbiEi antitoxin of type IV toxin-antitoxin system
MDLKKLEGLAFLDASCPLPLDRPFTTKQAQAEGVTLKQLTWLVRNGYLRRPIKGVFLAAQAGDSTHLRCQALSLVVPQDCVVCDRHAGWLLGAEMVLAPNEHLALRPISVFRPAGFGRLRNGLADSGERNLKDSEIIELDGLRVTTPIRTAWDLGRVRWTDQAIAGIDAMLALGVDKSEFLDGIERFRRMRWVTVLRAVGPLGDGRSQSPGESVLRLRWVEAQLPTPHPQLEVHRDGVLIAILDIANSELRYAAEYDGKEWHSSTEQMKHDRLRRDDVRDEGWVVDAFGSENLFGRHQDVDARLRAGAIEARQKFGSRVA